MKSAVRAVFVLSFVLLLGLLAWGFAQPATVEELMLDLRTTALVAEEPMGTRITCDPYGVIYPDRELACTQIFLPASILRIRFESYVRQQDALAWVEEDWEPVEVPGGVEAGRTESMRRTLRGPAGIEFVIAVYDLAPARHVVVVASEAANSP